jgi:type IV secretory pathway VirB10-like protein
MAEDKEEFLSRWSRLKHEQRAAEAAAEAPPVPAPAQAEEAAPELPPVEQLTPESDFAPFMHPKVADSLRRTALKKLFSDPRYNVIDKFEAYSDDYTVAATTTPEMLRKLEKVRERLEQEKQATPKQATPEVAAEQAPAEPPAAATEQANAPEPEPKKKDGAGTQDT